MYKINLPEIIRIARDNHSFKNSFHPLQLRMHFLIDNFIALKMIILFFEDGTQIDQLVIEFVGNNVRQPGALLIVVAMDTDNLLASALVKIRDEVVDGVIRFLQY